MDFLSMAKEEVSLHQELVELLEKRLTLIEELGANFKDKYQFTDNENRILYITTKIDLIGKKKNTSGEDEILR
jgi:hypothetical protein